MTIIFLLAISLHTISANDNQAPESSSFLESLRPYIRQYLGSEMELKILGKTASEKLEDAIILPVIPEVKDAQTSTEVYNKKADKVTLASGEEEKFYKSFIRDVYKSVRRQDPTDEEMNRYMGILLQGGAREGIYRSMVLDEVYAKMENYDMPINSKVADLAVHVYGTYLGKTIQKEKLKGINFYSIKRLVAERALEVIDSFGEDREALENWYAILSADLANRHGANFSNQFRKNSKKSVHKKWAQKYPVQHLKSEVLVKLHTSFNSLM
jgi:hypothetical protein